MEATKPTLRKTWSFSTTHFAHPLKPSLIQSEARKAFAKAKENARAVVEKSFGKRKLHRNAAEDQQEYIQPCPATSLQTGDPPQIPEIDPFCKPIASGR